MTCVMVIVHYTAVETSVIGWRGQHTLVEQSLSFNPKKTLQELDTLADSETKNRDVVLKLYDALRSRDVESVHKTLTPDLDYWFHGPPPHQFLMRTLTGVSPPFQFSPLSVVSFGSTVIAEGCDAATSISWIHAWTVSHGVITQVREYSNTSLTVTRIGGNVVSAGRSAAEIKPSHCPSVWESKFSGRAGKSVPGLVLAI
ncbi:Senescence associated protein 20 [Hirschfeldia incana]|nr:Senescence associated protein 20 [Hirschfeldia incana]